MTQYCSAIFLDFDNIYGSLFNRSHEAAHGFANDPRLFLDFLKEMPGDNKEEAGHNFLIRRCYMNPGGIIPTDKIFFSAYRQKYVRDGWEVIDTPPLTTHGK